MYLGIREAIVAVLPVGQVGLRHLKDCSSKKNLPSHYIGDRTQIIKKNYLGAILK